MSAAALGRAFLLLLLVGPIAAAPAQVAGASSAAPGASAASAAQTGPPSSSTATKNLPHIQVSEGDTAIHNGASITIPDTPVAAVSQPLTFTITNSGDAPLKLSRFDPPQLDGDGSLFYLLDLSALTMTIDPGQSASIAVSFFPSWKGPEAVRLIITSNDPATPVFEVKILATGVANPAFGAVSSTSNGT